MQPPQPAPVRRPARAPASWAREMSLSSSGQLHSYTSLHPVQICVHTCVWAMCVNSFVLSVNSFVLTVNLARL